MSEEEDLLSKVDALLKRHQPAAPVPTEIPMLNDVVTEPGRSAASPIDIPILTSIVESALISAPDAPPASITITEEAELPSVETHQPSAETKSVSSSSYQKNQPGEDRKKSKRILK